MSVLDTCTCGMFQAKGTCYHTGYQPFPQPEPRVKPERRELLDTGHAPTTASELAYLLSAQVARFLGAHAHDFESFEDALRALWEAEENGRVVQPAPEGYTVEEDD